MIGKQKVGKLEWAALIVGGLLGLLYFFISSVDFNYMTIGNIFGYMILAIIGLSALTGFLKLLNRFLVSISPKDAK